MKIALIGDVHANLPALEAVLDHAGRQGARDELWNVGDFVGYGPFPDEVVKVLRTEKTESIIGNYDQKVLQVSRRKQEWQKSKPPEKWIAFKWAWENLSRESRDFLRELPAERRLEACGKRILLIHGSPLSIKEHLTPDTPEPRLRELSRAARADIIICGHSHIPFIREVDGVFFLNPGSVGRPDDGDPRASYAVLELTSRRIRLQHHRVAYDVERTLAALREHGLPEVFGRMLSTGRNYDQTVDDTDTFLRPPPERRPLDREGCLAAVRALAARPGFEAEHAEQVARLSLLLFDQLQALHQLGSDDRLLLEMAALLHDVGIAAGAAGHHKLSLRIIMEKPLPPLSAREQLIVANVARYHRKALPEIAHEHFASLPPADQRRVEAMAAILRVADALDRGHHGAVKAMTCEVSPTVLKIQCASKGDIKVEVEAVQKKGDLLQRLLSREIIVRCYSL